MTLLSLCMIMKNEEAELPIVLQSAAPFVDEVVIYDTGSTDGSVPLARSLGATVVEGYWDHDFARARNAALDHCRGEWILWLDADESLHGDAAAFRTRLGGDDQFESYLLPIESIEGNGLAAHTVFRAARVFRRAVCHWHGPIHEQIGRREDDSVPATTLGIELRILHRGYTQIKADAKDLIQRNLAIAKAAVDNPDVDRSRALFDYGRTLTQTDDYEEGIARLREALELTPVPTVKRGALRTIFNTQVAHKDLDAAGETLDELEAASRTTVAVDALRAQLLLAMKDYEACLAIVDRLPFVDTDEDGMEYGRNSVAHIKASALSSLGRHGEAADALLDTLRTHGQLDADMAVLARLLVAADRSPAEIVTHARPESMPVLVAMASKLPALHADEVLAAFAERYPDRLEPLAASAPVVPHLPVPRAMWWSARLRHAGLSASCPLVSMAADEDRAPMDRLVAAAAGYLAFTDQRLVAPARIAYGHLTAEARPEAVTTVAGISAPLARLLTTTTVAVRLVEGSGQDGYVTCSDPTALPLGPGSAHELAAGDALGRFGRLSAGAVIGEWARVLAPGGRCTLEVTDLEQIGALLASGAHETARLALFGASPDHHPRLDAWTAAELRQQLVSTGFDVESIEPDGSAPTLRAVAVRRGVQVRLTVRPAPTASVVVVAGEGRDRLLTQLRALSTVDAGADFETVVLVNGADAAARALLDALEGDVTVAYSPDRLDWAFAVDEAARLAQGHTVVVLQGTTGLHPGWLAGLLSSLDDYGVGIAGARVTDGAGLVTHAGFDLTAGTGSEAMTLAPRCAYLRAEDEKVTTDADVDAVGPEGLAARLDTWHDLGGLAPGWSPAEAVADLGLRARERGLRVVAAGASAVAADVPLSGPAGYLARRWAGRVPLKPAARRRTSASNLMPATSLIERIAGDLPLAAEPARGGANLVGAFPHSRVLAFETGLRGADLEVSRLGWVKGAPEVLDGEPLPYAATVLVVDGDRLTDYFGEVGIDSLRHRHTVLAWDWPLAEPARDVAGTSSMVNEIWVPSSFSHRAVSAVSTRPVYRVPPPVIGADEASRLPAPGDAPAFVTVARPAWGRRRDLDLAYPEASVQAFTSAFAPGAGPTLTVVLAGTGLDEVAARCAEAAGGRADVTVVVTADEAEIDRRADAAHCHLSLHRASAFGPDLARALAGGRPVVATAYGGPMDYLGEDTAELVGFTLAPMELPWLDALPEAEWATPDIDGAAAALRRVAADYDDACRRAWKGRSLLTRNYSRKAVAKLISRRLAPVTAAPVRRTLPR